MVALEGIDKKKTKLAAHEVLKNYRKLVIVAKRKIHQNDTTDSSYQSNIMKDDRKRMSAKQDAEIEVERIRNAIESIPNDFSKKIVLEKYINGYVKSDSECQINLKLSNSTFKKYKTLGLLAFAWAVGCEQYDG